MTRAPLSTINDPSEVPTWLGVEVEEEDKWVPMVVFADDVHLQDLVLGYPVTGISTAENFGKTGIRITLGHMEMSEKPAGNLYLAAYSEVLVVRNI